MCGHGSLLGDATPCRMTEVTLLGRQPRHLELCLIMPTTVAQLSPSTMKLPTQHQKSFRALSGRLKIILSPLWTP